MAAETDIINPASHIDTARSQYFKGFSAATVLSSTEKAAAGALDDDYDLHRRDRALKAYRIVLIVFLCLSAATALADWLIYPATALRLLPIRVLTLAVLGGLFYAIERSPVWAAGQIYLLSVIAVLFVEVTVIVSTLTTTGAASLYNFTHIVLLLSIGVFLFSSNTRGAIFAVLAAIALIVFLPNLLWPLIAAAKAVRYSPLGMAGYFFIAGISILGAFITERLEKERFFAIYALRRIAADSAESVALQNDLISRQLQTESSLKESIDLQNDLIGRQLQTESSLKEERNLMRTMIDNLPHLIYVKDTGGRYVLSNAAHTESLGAISDDDVVGKTDFDFFPLAVAEKLYNDEAAMLADGFSRINHEELHHDELGQPIWLSITKMILRDAEGNVTGLVALNRDVTAQKLAGEEMRRLNNDLQEKIKQIQETQAYLIQTEKMSSLGQMVAGIAHELNTPIGYTSNNIAMIQERFVTMSSALSKALQAQEMIYSDQLEQALGVIEEVRAQISQDQLQNMITRSDRLFAGVRSGLDQMTSLVRGMRNFSRLDEADMKKADIHEGLKNSILMVGHLLKDSGVQISTHYGNLPPVDCFPAQLNQVFLNLITNAIQAVEQKQQGEVSIWTSLEDHFAVVRITDNGPGIPKHVQPKIFDPFFTTKPVGQGTGLGLSICYDIMKRHGGTLTFETEENVGTSFIVRVPAVEFKTIAPQPSPQTDAAAIGASANGEAVSTSDLADSQ
ncbi:MAG: PAS domain-containing protein [Rhizobacter sp.]|nr:PAS domain-containing protein [Chlorobiales bacterium]